jgi:hypothetical protein
MLLANQANLVTQAFYPTPPSPRQMGRSGISAGWMMEGAFLALLPQLIVSVKNIEPLPCKGSLVTFGK